MAEFDLGTLPSNNAVVVPRRTISNLNSKDTYSFRLDSDKNINLGLVGMTDDLNVQLFRDFNGNGLVDGNDKQIAISDRLRLDEVINLSSAVADVDAGNYVVQVNRNRAFNDTPYNLRVSADAAGTPSKVLAIEHDFGAVFSNDKPRTHQGSVGNTDTTDTIHLAVNTQGFYHFGLNNLSADADLRLIQDKNNNRAVDAGEVIGSVVKRGTISEGFVQNLAPATNYYLQASQFTGNTNYNVTVTPIPN